MQTQDFSSPVPVGTVGRLTAWRVPARAQPSLRLILDDVQTSDDRPEHQDVILFDGVCHLCLGSVRFLLRHDLAGRYRLAWLQSVAARRLLASVTRPPDDSVVLVSDGRVYYKSTAILRALAGLGGLWRLAGILLIIPRPWRDALYAFVGRRRYRWFGRSESCALPGDGAANRFLADGTRG